MQGFDRFEFWRQRREELLREAQINRLARAARSARKKKSRQKSAPGWELHRYGGRLSKLLRAFRHVI